MKKLAIFLSVCLVVVMVMYIDELHRQEVYGQKILQQAKANRN